jgi:hypothetical protein
LAEPGGPTDPLYEAAFRLARLYAILSPRVLMRELRVDRDRAEALLEELERNQAVGPTVIKGTGARESRINIVEDEPAKRASPVVPPDPKVGRRLVLLAGLTALLGLGCVTLLSRLGVGDVVNRWLQVEIGSPLLAAVVRAGLPGIGLFVGWLVEIPLRRNEDFAPYWAVRVHDCIWSGATLTVVLVAVLRLLS